MGPRRRITRPDASSCCAPGVRHTANTPHPIARDQRSRPTASSDGTPHRVSVPCPLRFMSWVTGIELDRGNARDQLGVGRPRAHGLYCVDGMYLICVRCGRACECDWARQREGAFAASFFSCVRWGTRPTDVAPLLVCAANVGGASTPHIHRVAQTRCERRHG